MSFFNKGEKKEPKERKPVSKLRLGFILALVGVGIALGYYFNKNNPRPAVLGETTTKPITFEPTNLVAQIQTAGDSSLVIAKDKGQELAQFVTNQFQQTIGDVASKSADKASDIIIQNTVGNLVKQIDKLPQHQKEEIKKQICQ